ncbi:3-deoxy-manno-octulosonate cytidylyltransferase [Nocardioides astragali]|uniref:3-deoxy-manno-octulosonate cytidylyltransferase n=1 Tax=Nocardioides astragali TaxID=1776736 RepID=A0ABW2N1U5_9ACTN|nr:3-deoxy-manno-octulosonate cytidylyltransferase [Nocardioides astragali]
MAGAVRALAVIPARMASTRLPGKPLLLIEGRTIVQWVHDATASSGVFDRVVVATDDERIAEAVDAFGGESLMTSSDVTTGSERVAEAAAAIGDRFDVVANVQGDQPFVSAGDLRALIAPFTADPQPEMTTLAAPLDASLADDPSAVKVVTDLQGRALYFSRSRIPAQHPGSPELVPLRHHLGLYAFRWDFLPVFATLPPTPLEQMEQLEQLRALEHGYAVHVGAAEKSTIEVNTADDYERAVAASRRSFP